MPPIAYFGIESSGLSVAVDLLIVFLVVLYFSLIYWTYADARRRISDPLLVGCATVVSLLFPLVGTVVYMILRPPEYLEDVRERELELEAAEARLHDLDYSLCPHCDYRIERDFVRCPSCLRKLKERCMSCSRPLDRTWTICPYCETEVPAAKSPRRTRRDERASSTRASADSETRVDPLERELETAGPARGPRSKAARGPESTTFVEESSPLISESSSLGVELDLAEQDREPQVAPRRSAPSRRPRSTS